MNYKEFLEQTSEEIMKKMPGIVVQPTQVEKFQGRSYEGLLVRTEGQGDQVGISMDVHNYFNQLQQGKSLGNVTTEMAFEFSSVLLNNPINEPEVFTDYSKMKDHLSLEVVPVKGNEKMLRETPHRTMIDLALIFRVNMENERGSFSAVINNQSLEAVGVTPKQLYEDAMDIVPKNQPAVMGDLFSFAPEMQRMDQIDPDYFDSLAVIATTPQGQLGASVIAYPDFMNRASEVMHGDFFMIPCSIHEVILVPDNGDFTVDGLTTMVHEVNMTEVAPEDRLSDNVYHYDSQERIFEKAADFEDRQRAAAARSDQPRSVLSELSRNAKVCEAQPKPEKTTKSRDSQML